MTHNLDYVDDSIERAAERVGSVWPLHSFVAANPLAGFEDRRFPQAVAQAERLFGGRGYPEPETFRRAWQDGRIDPEILAGECAAHDVDRDPETLLAELEARARESTGRGETDPRTEQLDRVLTKWLAAFLDQGQADWTMPNRQRGFYAAWREVAPYDEDIPGCHRPSDLPETAIDALESVLSSFPQRRWETIFEKHLAALPGWTGFVKQRADGDSPWQTAAPISLTEYLAVRLTLAELLGAPVDPEPAESPAVADDRDVPLAELWLTAWEKSYRQRLLENIQQSADNAPTDTSPSGRSIDESPPEATTDASPPKSAISDSHPESTTDDSRPTAQLVFCIDTRSEIIRRHVEEAGPYKTDGYAGFFGVPMRYQGYDADVEIEACPPIVEPQHTVVDRPVSDGHGERTVYDRWSELLAAGNKHLKTLKTDVAAAFPFVEGAGGAYGLAMAARTLSPAVVHDAADAVNERVPSPPAFCHPVIDDYHENASDDSTDDSGDARGGRDLGLSLAKKLEYAETAFELMGWTEFGRLVVFTGHASETTNNPFASSLDCGACAGNPGGPNARVLAAICNDETVQSALRDRGFEIPSDTVFLAAEHNTTTDEITLFDGSVPESHRTDLERLREDLEEARAAATAERVDSLPGGNTTDSAREAKRRAADWAEPRPEWGLAGNASFVIGPRELTAGQDLDGRAFLHSYDWSTDPDGEALAAIMTGPLIVTQWINNQYYFATVDNSVYGSGSKITQNVTGNVGIVQGNGGDLMTGLPLQSLTFDHQQAYHQPLRLTVVIHAPVERVTDVLRANEQVARLFDNGWARLTVVDPEQDNEPFHYQGTLEWNRESAAERTATAPLAD